MDTYLKYTLRIIRKSGGTVLLVIALSWFIVFGVRVVIPVLFPEIQAEFDIGNTLIGVSFTVLLIANAIAQIPGGVLSDFYGERRVLVGSVSVGVIGLIAFTIAPIFGVFFLACGIFGFSAGLYGPPRSILLEKVYPKNGATAQGVTFAAGSLGAATFPYIAGRLSTSFGWRSVFAIAVLIFSVTTVGLWFLLPKRTGSNTSRKSIQLKSLKKALSQRSILIAGSAFTMIEFIFQAITSFLPLYLVVQKDLDPGSASILFGLFFGVGIIIQPIAGRAGDKYGYRVTLATGTGILAVGLALLPATDGFVNLALLVALLRTGHAGIAPITMSYLISALPSSSQGSGFGTIRTIYLGLSSFGATFVGVLADQGLFDEAFLLLAGLCGVALLFYLILPQVETHS